MTDTDESRKRSRTERRETAATDALRAYVRDVAESEFVAPAMRGGPVSLHLELEVDPAEGWGLSFTPSSLRDQVLDQLAEAFTERASFQPGRIYCYRCQSSECDHASPPAPTSVFKGYESTGQPEWHDLSQALLRARDERVDGLYERPPRVAALVEKGSVLKARQLSSFGRGSKAYALLGQVVCGYFLPDPVPGEASRERFAVTFQFVESRTPSGEVLLRINPLCRLPRGRSLEDLFADGWGGWVHRAVRRGERSLRSMARRINEAGPDRFRVARTVLSRIPAEMGLLAQSIDRGHRQTRRRTRHAEQRRTEQRPVQMAVRDAERIGDTELLYEERSDAVVVPGPQGRIHLFSREGRHVTSFVGKPDTVKRRLASRRWTPLEPGAVPAFRSGLRAD